MTRFEYPRSERPKHDNNFFKEFIPSDELNLGMVIVRGEDCMRCGKWWSHSYTLVRIRPRRWLMECLNCSSRLQKEEN